MTKKQQTQKKVLKTKVCAYSKCDVMFTPRNGFQKTHHWECAIKYQKEQNEKRIQKEKNLSLKEFNQNDVSWLKKNAQKAFNAYIRERDRDLGCISCGNTTRQMHCGHFKSQGGNGNLRFNEDNCHKQCALCNEKLSGNLILYRENLIKKIGQERVYALDIKEVKSYSVIDLRAIIITYKQKLKDLG